MSSMSGMSMPSATTSGSMSSMSGHSGMSNMSDMDSMMTDHGMMPASMMAMTFFTSNATPLWSDALSPNSDGQYAGVCILLIVLSFILRALLAVKSTLEARWYAKAVKRRYIVPVRTNSDAASGEAASKEAFINATLTTRGCTEEVRIVESPESSAGGAHLPWRFSVDVSRAVLVTILLGIGYLLMLAVMTLNVGYFLAVLGGAFLGELFFGRFSSRDGVGH